MNRRQKKKRRKRRQEIKAENKRREKEKRARVNPTGNDIMKTFAVGGAMALFGNFLKTRYTAEGLERIEKRKKAAVKDCKMHYTPEELERIEKRKKAEEPKEPDDEKPLVRKLELED